MKQIGFLITAILLLNTTIAQQKKKENKPVRFLAGIALEFGGDQVAEVLFEDGSTQGMNAGQGGTVFAGGQFRLNQKETFFLRASAGIKYVTTKADNAHIRLTRFPLQLTVNYVPVKKMRLAAGVVTHQAIRLNFDGLGDNTKFTSSPGLVMEVGYGVFGLSYTLMTYQNPSQESFRANAIGLTVSGVF